MFPLKQKRTAPLRDPCSQLCRRRSLRQRLARILSIPLVSLVIDADDVQAYQTHTGSEPRASQLPPSTLGQWWNGPYATGDWLGARTFLEDHGLKFKGMSTAIYYGVPTNDLRHNSVFCYNLTLDSEFDFGKMIGLKGLKGIAGIQWETGENFRDNPGAGIAFSPAAFTGLWKWRLRPIVLTYITPELFKIKEFLTLSGGWQSPANYFIQQPAATLFQNYAFYGGPLVANGIPFDGNYVAWGGYTKIKPTEWIYLQAGLWAAVPNALDWHNRGVYFALSQRHKNGLFFMGETGVTPAFGSQHLPGKYAFGSYYWGLPCRSFLGASYPGNFGFYWQADQMLFREATSQSLDSMATWVGKSSSSISKASGPSAIQERLSPQGLYAFSLLVFAPKFYNALPFFLRTGLVYKGLIPTRDKDDFGIAFAYGNYSYYKILANRAKHIHIQRTNEALLEIDYRLQVNRWLYTQPFLEYIIHPNGDGQSKNALVVGIATRVTF